MYVPYIDIAKALLKNAITVVEIIKFDSTTKMSLCKKVCKIVSPSMVKLLS